MVWCSKYVKKRERSAGVGTRAAFYKKYFQAQAVVKERTWAT